VPECSVSTQPFRAGSEIGEIDHFIIPVMTVRSLSAFTPRSRWPFEL
jgi:hypothetical protein